MSYRVQNNVRRNIYKVCQRVQRDPLLQSRDFPESGTKQDPPRFLLYVVLIGFDLENVWKIPQAIRILYQNEGKLPEFVLLALSETVHGRVGTILHLAAWYPSKHSLITNYRWIIV